MIELMSQLDLQEQALDATRWYIKQNYPNFTTMTVTEQHDIFNTAFRCFFMGVRFLENKINGTTVERMEIQDEPKTT